jgi:heterodisulfide reductase subunit B
VGEKTGKKFNLPVLYFTQVIGLAIGLDEKDLGFEFNRVRADRVIEKLRSY